MAEANAVVRVEPGAAFRDARDSGSSSHDPAALRDRVAFYFKLLSILFGAFYVLDAREAVVSDPTALLAPGLATHLGLVVMFVLAWAYARRGSPSPGPLIALEVSGTLLIALAAAALATFLPRDTDVLGPAFAVAFALVVRAAIIPSSFVRTLAVGVFASAAVSGGYLARGQDSLPSPSFVAAWTLAFTLASSAVSRVIYGLQREIRRARQLGQYVLETKLGEGGMGVVYRAQHAMLRRPTAVKLLLPEKTGADSLARFEHEVRQTARLSHPNTVTIYDYGRTPDGVFYYAMELLDGADLGEVVAAGGPLSPERVVHILTCVAAALSEAHAEQLIHRDIKPSNIILCRQGGMADFPKLVDFGLVKELNTAVDLTNSSSDVLLGTPLYLPPESVRSPKDVDGRSDLYALGAVGYYLLTGEHVFEDATLIGICLKHLESAPIPPSQRGQKRAVPGALEQLILGCLAKAQADRPATATLLHAELNAIASTLPPWTAARAEAWWNTHLPWIRARRAGTPISPTSRTLEVDFARRS